MSDVSLLVNISVALAYALAGGLIARRVGLPTIVGYMMAGVLLGPSAPGYTLDDPHAISQFAEFGVILLMFGVGLHFSFRDLWQVRQVAVPGAVIQMAAVSVVGYLLGRTWGFSVGGAWVLGIAISVTSTVVLMRSLMDYGWLETPPGKVAIGWLVLEDLLTVAILVLLPAITVTTGDSALLTVSWAMGKAALFLALMLIVGSRVVPFLLGRVVNTRSRELFVLVALTVAVGTALASAALFQVSLALGAFVAGVVVSESPFSHQIGADLLPFREAFAVVFFVSVGMLVNPAYLFAHWDQVLAITAVIIIIKGMVSGLLGAVLPATGRTALVLAAGRGQIGEFSFIVGQTGVTLGLIDNSQYSLILAGAIISITLNSLVFRLVEPLEQYLKRWPQVWRFVNHGAIPATLTEPGHMRDHVVIVGCGRVGRHLSEALGRLQIPRLVVESDPVRLRKLQEIGVPSLFGDAGSSEILERAGLAHARALVITLPDDAAALAVAVTVRHEAPALHMVARASTWDGAKRLKDAGVNEIVRPELEGGVEIVRRTLLDLSLPVGDVQRYIDLIRREGMHEAERPTADQARVLDQLMTASRDLEVVWVPIHENSTVADRTIAEVGLRSKTGASIVGLARNGSVDVNPGPDVRLQAGDRIAVIGKTEEIRATEMLVAESVRA